MPSTFQALGVALLALLPGALCELAREQRSGRWRLRGADQLFRLLAFSVVFQVVIAPLTYWLYAHYIVTGHLREGRPVSGWLWVLLCVYLVVPFAFGLAPTQHREVRAHKPDRAEHLPIQPYGDEWTELMPGAEATSLRARLGKVLSRAGRRRAHRTDRLRVAVHLLLVGRLLGWPTSTRTPN